MKSIQIDVGLTDFFKPAIKEYLIDESSLAPMVNTEETSELLNQIKNQFPPTTRELLAESLKEQYVACGTEESSPVFSNIESFKSENTIAITAGQQIHPGIGPLFVLYKIWTAIDIAADLQDRYPDFNFIPVFWMATEDHDLEEVQSARLYNDIFTWETDQTGPVGRMNPSSLVKMMEDLFERSDKTERQKKLIDLCKDAYQNQVSYGRATHKIIHEIFKDSKLVVIDPDDKKLKTLFIDQMLEDIIENSSLSAIESNKSEMKKKGISIPIGGRKINHFYIENGIRERIDLDGELYSCAAWDSQLNKAQMTELIRNNPDRISPNALLRPSYQQKILPCSHYVCGGSEVMYWLELKALMAYQNIIFPKLPIRSSAFILGKKVLEKIEKQGIALEAIFRSDEAFLAEADTSLNERISQLKERTAGLEQKLESFEEIESYLSDNQKHARKRSKLSESFKLYSSQIEDELLKSAKLQGDSEKLLKLKRKIYSTSVQERTDHVLRYWDTLFELIIPSNRPKFNTAKHLQLLFPD